MSRIQQFNIAYIKVEDRLLLRTRTADGSEFRMMLTRHFLRLLWKVLSDMATRYAQAAAPGIEAFNEVAAFQKDQAVAASDFQTPYKAEEEAKLPLGEAPLLLARIAHKQNKEGMQILALGGAKGPMIDISCDVKLLHSLMKLLADASLKTDWELNLPMPGGSPLSEEVVPENAVRH